MRKVRRAYRARQDRRQKQFLLSELSKRIVRNGKVQRTENAVCAFRPFIEKTRANFAAARRPCQWYFIFQESVTLSFKKSVWSREIGRQGKGRAQKLKTKSRKLIFRTKGESRRRAMPRYHHGEERRSVYRNASKLKKGRVRGKA